MKVWLDDIRNPRWEHYTDFIWVRIYDEVIQLLSQGGVEVLSLDHDLGGKKTGYDVICWIEDQVLNHGMVCPSRIFVTR